MGDSVTRADGIMLLTGDVHMRPQKAAQLYRQGIAPRLLLAEQITTPGVAVGAEIGESDGARIMLARHGVPDSAIIELPVQASSTWDEARALREYVRQSGLKRFVVVTSASHGRRARWLFRKAFRGTAVDLRFATIEDWRYDMDEWWISETGVVSVANEYLRFMHNFITRR